MSPENLKAWTTVAKDVEAMIAHWRAECADHWMAYTNSDCSVCNRNLDCQMVFNSLRRAIGGMKEKQKSQKDDS